MSYCRFTESSDVYAYECDGGVQFWVAGKADKGLDRLCSTFNEAYQYAKVLRDKYGLNVPDTAIEELRADAIEEVKRINGVIEELYAENVKLRELVKAFDWCTENFDIRNKCDQCPLTQRSALDPECEAIMRELGMKGNDA